MARSPPPLGGSWHPHLRSVPQLAASIPVCSETTAVTLTQRPQQFCCQVSNSEGV